MLLAAAVAHPGALSAASILLYQRFGEVEQAATSISLEQFEAHLEELSTGGYAVLPVADIVAALRQGRELPDRTVGLTIDNAYLSAYAEAWPRLRQSGYPFTVFVTTDAIDNGYDGYMNWDQLRELRDAGATFGSKSAAHAHMTTRTAAEVQADVSRANERLRDELGVAAVLFAFPYGEADTSTMALLREAGFIAAFGQHSGVVSEYSEIWYLPRFSMTETFGDIERFRLVANALPLPISELSPDQPVLDRNPPFFGFTVDPAVADLSGLACYASGQGKARVEQLGPRIEVRFDAPFPPGRARINCTMPGDLGRWHWFGMLYTVPSN